MWASRGGVAGGQRALAVRLLLGLFYEVTLGEGQAWESGASPRHWFRGPAARAGLKSELVAVAGAGPAGSARASVAGSFADPDLGLLSDLAASTSRRAFQNAQRRFSFRAGSRDALCCREAEVGACGAVATAHCGEGEAMGGLSLGGTLLLMAALDSQTTGRPLGPFPDRTGQTCFGRKGPLVLGCDWARPSMSLLWAQPVLGGAAAAPPAPPLPARKPRGQTGPEAWGGVVQVRMGFGNPEGTAGSVALAPS